MRPLLAWLAKLLLGPLCAHGCGYRGRGTRSLQAHERRCVLEVRP